jgi:cytochrome P450
MIPLTFAKYFLLLIILETLLLRMPMFIYKYWYYKRQGVTFFKGLYPIYGNFFTVCRLMSETPKKDYVPFGPMLEESFGEGETPPAIVVAMMQPQPMIVLNTAEALTDIYITKNKFFDKDPMARISLGTLFGDSIILASSNEEWAKKRKILSSAFYKDKLVRMTDTIRKVVAQKIEEFEHNYVATGEPMDIVREMGDLQMRIILVSAFGLTNLN